MVKKKANNMLALGYRCIGWRVQDLDSGMYVQYVSTQGENLKEPRITNTELPKPEEPSSAHYRLSLWREQGYDGKVVPVYSNKFKS